MGEVSKEVLTLEWRKYLPIYITNVSEINFGDPR